MTDNRHNAYPIDLSSGTFRYIPAISLFLAILFSACSNEPAGNVSLFPLRGEQGFQYIDKTGAIIIPSQFSEAGMFRDGRALVKAGGAEGRWGFIDEKGTYVIQPNYREATRFSEGIALVNEKDGAPTAIGTNGDTLFTLKAAEHVMEFRGGFAAFSVSDNNGDERWGFIDRKGRTAIAARFSRVSGFSEGLAAVMNDKAEWGYIDESGTLVIDHQFDHAADFTEGLAVAGTGNNKGVIDRTGKFRINPMFSEAYSDGEWFLVEQNGKWGWVGADGNMIINPQFSEAMRFGGQDLAAVRTGKSWGYIGADGLYKINPQFNAALPFTGTVALVLVEKQSGLIGTDGKFVVNPQFGKPSREFVYALIRDPREFSSIQTDFFNLPALNAAIDPANLIPQSFSELSARMGIDPTIFSQSGRHVLIPERRISSDLSMTLYALGDPFRMERVQKNFGGYSYTDEEMVPDLSQPVTGYEYRIGLSGKGYGRNDAVMNSLRNEFPDALIVAKDDRQIILRTRDGMGTIRITSGYYAVTMRLTFGADDPDAEGAD